MADPTLNLLQKVSGPTRLNQLRTPCSDRLGCRARFKTIGGGGDNMIRVLRGGAVFVFAAFAGGAWAAETTIGGVSIKLPAPAGFCELSADQPLDNRALTTLGALLETGGSRLLGVSADCQQLADWRAGKRLLEDYAQFQTIIARMDQGVASPRAYIHEMCATLRARGNEINTALAPNIKSKMEAAVPNSKVTSQEFAGVLA